MGLLEGFDGVARLAEMWPMTDFRNQTGKADPGMKVAPYLDAAIHP